MLEEIKDPLQYIPKYLKVLTKNATLEPMNLWLPQKYYITNRTHRDIILKSRQQGASTGVLAANSHKLFTEPYQRAIIITHDQETSENLFQTIQRFHRNLPDSMRPQTDWKSGTRMRFPILDSYIYIDSARSENVGIGHTINIVHLSEVAKWPPSGDYGLFADITNTVPESGWMTLESTPKGRGGLFYDLYDRAKRGDVEYRPFFFPWWWDITCTRPVKNKIELTREEKDLINYVRVKDDIELTMQQIAFRREKIAELKDLFFQEFPENDIDCWLSGDTSVFDGVAIKRYLLNLSPGRQEGNVTIWHDAIGGEKYVMGVDTAAGQANGDFSVAAVINVKRNEYVARLRGRIPPDLFAEEVIRLGHRYNNALIGVERESHGLVVIRILLENNYPEIYYYIGYDDVLQMQSSQPGWKTNIKTKPIMISDLDTHFRTDSLVSWSENLMSEAGAYVWVGRDKAKPSGGRHDDELDAVMIALQLRQQTPIIEPRRASITSYARVI